MLASRLLRSAAAQSIVLARPSATRRLQVPLLQATTSQWIRGMAKDNGPRPPRPPQPNNQPRSGPSQPRTWPTPPPPSTPNTSPQGPSKPNDYIAPDTPAQQEPPTTPDLSSLPDLTQGIPSTLEHETTGSTKPASLLAVEEAEAATGGGRGRGELPASAYISSSERRRQKLASRLFYSFILLSVGGTCYLGRNWETDDERNKHPDAPNGWGMTLWWNRAMTRLREMLNYYHEPAFEKLLPDADPMFERPYTLCISLEDMLVHSEWTREHGWRVAKRPGMDYFLRYLSQYYELVIFTSVPWAMGEPLVRKLDPFRIVMWNLYREATKYKDGEIVKDLSYLNRDLSKVIMLDTKASHVSTHPENAIILPPWKGDPKDTALVDLVPFLEFVHTMQYSDVRDVLKSFSGKHIPTEFARREAIARKEFAKQRLTATKSKPDEKQSSGVGFIGSLLGLKPSSMSMVVLAEGEQDPTEAFAQGKMIHDLARERGRRNYEILEKEIRENGEKWIKEEQALQEKAQQEAVTSMKSSFMGWFLPASAEPPVPTPGTTGRAEQREAEAEAKKEGSK